MSLRVLLVDDQPIIRQGLRRLMEQDGLRVVGETEDSAEVHLLAAELRADVVVLGLTRPLEDFLTVAAEIRRTAPRVGVILVAFEDYLVVRAFQAGIRGYVLRTRVVEELPRAIRAVAGGKIYVSPGVDQAVAERRLTANDDFPARR
jgi:DNA-binding NarL/FixJ family response regulator